MSIFRTLWRISTTATRLTNPLTSGRTIKKLLAGKVPVPLDLGQLPFIDSVIDNVFATTVKPVPGSIVYCGLAMNAVTHTGIYIGGGKIVHLEGCGNIKAVTRAKFLNRLDGYNSAITVYVSSKDGKSVGSPEIAARAKAMVGQKRDYKLLSNNCHLFTATCIGLPLSALSTSLAGVQSSARRKIRCDDWLAWTLPSAKNK